ncbi:MAG: 16S rRNA (cytosine(1402)-N(4))-methyltransferase RsmH [Verrucomicrobia bacterium]|nr:16S rRNA (cytosine(1402)-N(4))-methyltransferase RsmH [Verrucomicrobiota bacterium]
MTSPDADSEIPPQAPTSGSPGGVEQPRKRRPRYPGKNPRKFEHRYKELRPEDYPATIEKVTASGRTPAGMHRPVLLREVLGILKPAPGETGVDCTLGYGGHATELWRAIQPGGVLIALDADPIELPRTQARMEAQLSPGDSLRCRHSNFAGLPKTIAGLGAGGVDFVLADLGVSSMQLDDPARGFSFKQSGPLDLRMNPGKGQSAAALIRRIGQSDLEKLLRDNADEPRAALIANHIVRARETTSFSTTGELADAIRRALRQPPLRLGDDEIKSAQQRVFQALRIAVNDEFSALESLLRHLPSCVNPGGRVAILTFHSGEDRRVKRAFEDGWRRGLYSEICDEVIRPGAEERHDNPRSSCAKLRWAMRSARLDSIPISGATVIDVPEQPGLEFRDSEIHGKGAFARVPVPSGTRVIEYVGERISKEESLRRCLQENEYIFSLDKESDLDGNVSWNPARLINHSCDPNSESIHADGRIWIVAIRDIASGEEVTFNYGFDLESYRDYPCRCGAAKCVGFIVAEEFHEHVRNQRLLAGQAKLSEGA